MTDHIAARGGLRLAADIGGPEDGPTVVLLHGGGQTRHSWAGTWRVLVDAGWRAISLDLRGHGDSEWSEEGDYSLDAFAGDLLAVVATLPDPAGARGRIPRRARVAGGGGRGARAGGHRPRHRPRRRGPPGRGVRAGSHRRVHDRQHRRVRLAGGGGRRHRRVQPPPTPAQGPVGAGQEPAPTRRRALGVALGPALRDGPARLGRRDPRLGGRPVPAGEGRRRPAPSRRSSSGAAAATSSARKAPGTSWSGSPTPSSRTSPGPVTWSPATATRSSTRPSSGSWNVTAPAAA